VGLSTQPNSFAACINNSQFHLGLYAICDGFRLTSVLFGAQLQGLRSRPGPTVLDPQPVAGFAKGQWAARTSSEVNVGWCV